MKNKDYYGYIFTAFSGVLTAMQDNELYQVINMILVILSLVINIIYTIYKWYKKASADKKINIDEVGDLVENVKYVIDETKEDFKNHDKNGRA